MARILIAESGEQDAFLQNLLRPRHDLVVVKRMTSAASRLKAEAFDLIIIDLLFDDSRMFDLMHLVKSIPINADKPIICFVSQASSISEAMHDGIDFAARALGAWIFLDAHQYNKAGDPHAELLRVIERCLTSQARKTTHAARVGLHKQRQEIHQLRLKMENEDWSTKADEQLVELKRKLTALLVDLCDLNVGSLSQQESIDESRNFKDRVTDNVVQAEDQATRTERKQTLEELHHAVDEFEMAEREEEKKHTREQRDK